jgi:hypothetical protein
MMAATYAPTGRPVRQTTTQRTKPDTVSRFGLEAIVQISDALTILFQQATGHQWWRGGYFVSFVIFVHINSA